MRGKASKNGRGQMIERITPAYAGKSVVNQPAEARLKDHPRLCGEKLTAPETRRGGTGSPPPMRGKAIGHRL